MPTHARYEIIDPDAVMPYHATSRTVRQVFLFSDEFRHRRQWAMDRLADLAKQFYVEINSYAIMSNHIHVCLTSRPDLAKVATDEDVVRRMFPVVALTLKLRDEAKLTPELLAANLADPETVKEARKRTSCVSWFMKSLLEPLARAINLEDGCTGHLWGERFFSQAIVDDEGKLATALYVETNPIKAGIEKEIEKCDQASIHRRLKEFTTTTRDYLSLIALQKVDGREPYLQMPLADYIAEVRRHADALLANREAVIDQWSDFKNATAIGSPGAVRAYAAKFKRKWCKGFDGRKIVEVGTDPCAETG